MDCPTPFKLCYQSPSDARRAIRNMLARNKKGKGEALPPHSYKCQCGGYHITTQRRPRKQSAACSTPRQWRQARTAAVEEEWWSA